MTQTCHGACHCGRVKFEVSAELNCVIDCSCSICRRTGAESIRSLGGDGGGPPRAPQEAAGRHLRG
jgi:hypothetical protein